MRQSPVYRANKIFKIKIKRQPHGLSFVLWWTISSRWRADRYALGPPLHGTYIGFRIADRRVRSSRGSNEMFGVKNAEKWRVPALFAFGPTQKSTQKVFLYFCANMNYNISTKVGDAV